jgi:hypothetical protein
MLTFSTRRGQILWLSVTLLVGLTIGVVSNNLLISSDSKDHHNDWSKD